MQGASPERQLRRRPARRDSTSLIRHLGICVATAAAYLLREELRVGTGVLWIIGLAASLNLATTVLLNRWRPLARLLSSAFGIGGWAALVLLTGGVVSPFVAGFGLEIVLSAMAFRPGGTVLVAGGAVAGLWTQQLFLGLDASVRPLELQTGFLVAMGVLTFFVSRRWMLAQERLSHQTSELRGRLQALEGELEDARMLGRVGEGVARLAHGLKNTVHSLRGFAQLIELQPSDGERGRRALNGLRASIEHLEELVRSTLSPTPSGEPANSHATGAEIRRTLEQVFDEVRGVHPEIRWVQRTEDPFPAIAAPGSLLREVLLVLAHNAAEASKGRGEVVVSTRADSGGLRFEVRDDGPGIAREDRGKLFRPGHTTKPQGSGFGLFLARRLVESHGGSLGVQPAGDRGTVCSASLPLGEGGAEDA